MNKIVIAGGTGFLGLNLADYLSNLGFEIVLISRNPPKNTIKYNHVIWDARTIAEWTNCLENASALINLAGRSVDCIKTPDNCDQILRSRVESTSILGAALNSIKNPPGVWIQMSTAHIYGDPPEVVCTEGSAYGFGLAPMVGKAWEKALSDAVLPGMRSVILRTSFVLGKNKGALKRLEKLVKFGLGGTVGSGQQGMSWIHEDDMNRIFERAITDDTFKGTYIATAPNPVSNRDFMKHLRQAMNVSIGLPAYEFMVRIGAKYILRTDPELALYGRYCISTKLEEEGFKFKFPEIKEAFQDIYTS